MREAKRRSSWAAPDADYEQATQVFAREALRSDTFLSNFLPFARRVARLGIENSLIQTVGKLTAPGLPDIYQGCELWDLNLVDPENPCPVDFAVREAAIADLSGRLKAPDQRSALFKTLMDEWQDGRVKWRQLPSPSPSAAMSRNSSPAAIISHSPSRANGRIGPLAMCAFRAKKARCRDGALPRASRGGAEWSAKARLPEARWFDLFRGGEATLALP